MALWLLINSLQYCATNLLVLYLSLFQACTLVNIKSVAYIHPLLQKVSILMPQNSPAR